MRITRYFDDCLSVLVRHFEEDELAWECEGMRQTDDGFYLALPIADVFHKFINGKRGETKRRLETETGAKIKLPRIGQPGDVGNLVISNTCYVHS